MHEAASIGDIQAALARLKSLLALERDKRGDRFAKDSVEKQPPPRQLRPAGYEAASQLVPPSSSGPKLGKRGV